MVITNRTFIKYIIHRYYLMILWIREVWPQLLFQPYFQWLRTLVFQQNHKCYLSITWKIRQNVIKTFFFFRILTFLRKISVEYHCLDIHTHLKLMLGKYKKMECLRIFQFHLFFFNISLDFLNFISCFFYFSLD